MATRAAWSPETKDLFTAALGSHRDRRFLVVERLPEGGWTWIAWFEDRKGAAQHGVAESVMTAMAAAEYAAALLVPGLDIFRPPSETPLQSPSTRLN